MTSAGTRRAVRPSVPSRPVVHPSRPSAPSVPSVCPSVGSPARPSVHPSVGGRHHVVTLSPVEWTCDLGLYMPTSGAFTVANFSGCLFNCSAGFFGNLSSHDVPECAGGCPPGFYCEKATVTPSACPRGTYDGAGFARSKQDCIKVSAQPRHAPSEPSVHSCRSGRADLPASTEMRGSIAGLLL